MFFVRRSLGTTMPTTPASRDKSVSVLLTNVRSYFPKKDAVKPLMGDNSTRIAIFTETWLTTDIRNDELLQDNQSFTFFRRDRLDRRGGGVMVLVNGTLISSSVTIVSKSEIFCVNISFAHRTTIIIACYRSSDSDRSFIDDVSCILLDVKKQFPWANLIGDFNIRAIDRVNITAPSRHSRDVLDLFLSFNLAESVGTPTCSSNTFDLVLVSNPELTQL